MTPTTKLSPWPLRWCFRARPVLFGAMLVLVGLAVPGRSPGQLSLPNDPVDDLRRILSTKVSEFLLPGYKKEEERTEAERRALKAREDAIRDVEKRITSLGDRSRALLLLEWQPTDRLLRDEMRQNFVTQMKQVLNSNDPPRLIAAADVLGDFVATLRKLPTGGSDTPSVRGFLEEPNPISGKMFELTKELTAMTEHPQPLVRAAGSVALAKVGPDPSDWGPVLRRLLADPDEFVRRATARAAREQVDALMRGITSPSPVREIDLPQGRKPTMRMLHYTRADFRRLGQYILEDLVAQPETGLTDADAATRWNSASLTLAIARGLRHLLTQDIPIDLETRQEESVLLADFINSRFRLTFDGNQLSLGRELTPVDVRQIETLQTVLLKDILEPNLGLIRAFRAASPQLAQVVLDQDQVVRLQARLTMEDLAAARTRGRFLLEIISRKVKAAPEKPRRDVRKEVDLPLLLPQPALEATQVALLAPNQDKANQVPDAGKPEAPKKAAGLSEAELARLRADLEEPAETQRALTQGMGVPFPDLRTGPAAADALEAMGDGVIPALDGILKGLCDWNPFVRWACIRALGKLAPSNADRIVPALMPLLKDKDVDVPVAAATALERFGTLARPAVSALTQVVGKGDDELRIAAMRALMAIGSPGAEAIPNILPDLKAVNRRVRLQAIRTLASFGTLARDTVDALRAVAHEDSDPDIRKAAADAMIKVLGD